MTSRLMGSARAPTPPINPRWVMATLKERGLPVPDLGSLSAGIADLEEGDLELLRSRVQRVARGTEQADDMATLADWSRTMIERQAKTASAEEKAPAAGENEVVGASNSTQAAAGEGEVAIRVYEKSHHVFGSKGALCFEPTEIRGERVGAADEVYHTLQIEMATAISRQRFDWAHKIVFRLTRRELPLFVAALFGWCPQLEFGNHGSANDKFLEVRDQVAEGSIFVKLKQGKRVIAVPLGGEELFAVASMALKVLGHNAPYLDSQTLLQMVKRAGTMYAKSVGAAA